MKVNNAFIQVDVWAAILCPYLIKIPLITKFVNWSCSLTFSCHLQFVVALKIHVLYVTCYVVSASRELECLYSCDYNYKR